jgi:hypothetical protein
MANTSLRFHSWVPSLLQACTSLTGPEVNCGIRAKCMPQTESPEHFTVPADDIVAARKPIFRGCLQQ